MVIIWGLLFRVSFSVGLFTCDYDPHWCADLPSGLYPTVGLQTPGEVIDANFGQEPFKFDIEGEMRELRRKTQGVIEDLSWPRKHGDAQAVLHNMVELEDVIPDF